MELSKKLVSDRLLFLDKALLPQPMDRAGQLAVRELRRRQAAALLLNLGPETTGCANTGCRWPSQPIYSPLCGRLPAELVPLVLCQRLGLVIRRMQQVRGKLLRRRVDERIIKLRDEVVAGVLGGDHPLALRRVQQGGGSDTPEGKGWIHLSNGLAGQIR